jgi:hypothetical protein
MMVNFICTHKHGDVNAMYCIWCTDGVSSRQCFVNAMYCIWCTDGVSSRQCFASHNRVARKVKITPPPFRALKICMGMEALLH